MQLVAGAGQAFAGLGGGVAGQADEAGAVEGAVGLADGGDAHAGTAEDVPGVFAGGGGGGGGEAFVDEGADLDGPGAGGEAGVADADGLGVGLAHEGEAAGGDLDEGGGGQLLLRARGFAGVGRGGEGAGRFGELGELDRGGDRRGDGARGLRQLRDLDRLRLQYDVGAAAGGGESGDLGGGGGCRVWRRAQGDRGGGGRAVAGVGGVAGAGGDAVRDRVHGVLGAGGGPAGLGAAEVGADIGDVAAGLLGEGAVAGEVVVEAAGPGVVSGEESGGAVYVVHLADVGGAGHDVVVGVEGVVAELAVSGAQFVVCGGHDLHEAHGSGAGGDKAAVAAVESATGFLVHDGADPGFGDVVFRGGLDDVGTPGVACRAGRGVVATGVGLVLLRFALGADLGAAGAGAQQADGGEGA